MEQPKQKHMMKIKEQRRAQDGGNLRQPDSGSKQNIALGLRGCPALKKQVLSVKS